MKQKGNGRSLVVVRTDASQSIGFGHLRRCATLGRKLSEFGVAVHFLLKAQDVDLSVELNGFAEASVLFDPELDGEADAARTVEYCQRVGAERVIVDHYNADEAYQRVLLNAGLRWLQFDGAAGFPLWADWVVSMSPAADAERYNPLQRRPHTRMMLGPRYAILRDEFLQWRQPRPAPPQAQRLLLIFGGGDDRGACLACLDALRQVDIFEITILTGGRNPQVPSIQAWMKQNATGRVCLLLDDADVARRMAEADIAITAGGTTTFETALVGLPTLIVQIADNQRVNSQAWGRIGAAVDLGPLDDLNAGQLRDQLVKVAGNSELRERMSLLGREQVDGLGTGRLVRELYPNMGNIP